MGRARTGSQTLSFYLSTMALFTSLALTALILLLLLVLLAFLLRIAARWVLGCWTQWRMLFKTVVLTLIASLIIQVLIALTIALYYQSLQAAMMVLETHAGLNLMIFLFIMLVHSYIYGHWLSCSPYSETPGLLKGLLIFWAQFFILLVFALLLAAGILIFME